MRLCDIRNAGCARFSKISAKKCRHSGAKIFKKSTPQAPKFCVKNIFTHVERSPRPYQDGHSLQMQLIGLQNAEHARSPGEETPASGAYLTQLWRPCAPVRTTSRGTAASSSSSSTYLLTYPLRSSADFSVRFAPRVSPRITLTHLDLSPLK